TCNRSGVLAPTHAASSQCVFGRPCRVRFHFVRPSPSPPPGPTPSVSDKAPSAWRSPPRRPPQGRRLVRRRSFLQDNCDGVPPPHGGPFRGEQEPSTPGRDRRSWSALLVGAPGRRSWSALLVGAPG